MRGSNHPATVKKRRDLAMLAEGHGLVLFAPFWQGGDSGLQGLRLAAFREWPRKGLPEIFADDEQYNRCIDQLVAGKTTKDASFIWWLIRSSTQIPRSSSASATATRG